MKNIMKTGIEFFRLLAIAIFAGSTGVIPGVSGGTILAIFNITEDLTVSIKNLISFKITLNNIKLPIIIGLGSLISVFVFANIIKLLFEEVPFFISFMFIGLIIFSLPILWKEANKESNVTIDDLKKKKFYFLIGFFIMITILILFGDDSRDVDLNFLKTSNFIIKYFIVSIIAGMTIIVPGISGTNIMIMFGVYPEFTFLMSNINDYAGLYIMYLVASVIGIIISSYFLSYIYTHFRLKFFSIMTGITLATTYSLLLLNPFPTLISEYLEIFIGFFIGYIIIKILARENK